MTAPRKPTRRAVMTAMASLPLSGTMRASTDDVIQKGSGILVAYFSRSGNTRVFAGLIHRSLDTDLFEIRPAKAYPADYLETVAQATKERDANYEPALASKVPNMADYTTIFLGFPIWGETTPPIIRTFLSAHDFTGKILVPFVTHGGYGLGNSRSVLARHAPNSNLLEGFTMQADQERQTMEQVRDWLSNRKN